MNWVMSVADWVRGLASGQDWLAWLVPHLEQAPDWVLVIPAPLLALGLLVWGVGHAKKTSEDALDTVREGAAVLTGGAIKAKPAAANVDHVKELEAMLAVQNPDSAEAQRDLSVSMIKLGDVLVKAGDLAGAKARFEAALGVSEKLASQNPDSAEAQRDLIVSYAKMAQTFPGQGWWGKAHDVATRLNAEGRLAPVDAWMVEHAATQAAAEQAAAID